MAFSASKIIVIYRDGDSSSESLADSYVSLHNLASDQKRSISCSSTEILADEATFNSQVLNPIKSEISSVESGGRTIWGVLLCYNIPGGFYDSNGNIISSTSRISRINHSFSAKKLNKLFDRKSFQLFDSTDSQFALICSRIDGPTLDITENMIDSADELKRQLFANGIFYLDPYSDRQGDNASEYEKALLEFQERLLPSLNLDTFSTTFLDPYVDSLIPKVTDDSFIWSWFTDRGSPDFFNTSASIRIFGYNADYDGAETIRDATDRRWPQLFLQNNYVATAGSMSDPGNDGFLFPTPFVTTLLQGGTIGEAFLFSQPYLDWTISVFGDPLAKVSFPAQPEDEDEDNTEEKESWRLMLNDLARSVAYYIRKTDALEENRDRIVLSQNVPVTIDLLQNSINLLNAYNDNQRKSQLRSITEKLMTHIEDRYKFVDISIPQPDFDNYLSLTGQKISELVYDVQPDDNKASSLNIYPQGYWEIERTIFDDSGEFAFYHFELQISDKEDFSNILIEKKSIENLTGWSFESNLNEFIDLSTGGVPSKFVGRRIKFSASEDDYLSRAELYWFRLRQRDQNTIYTYRTWKDIIYT